MRQCGLVAVLLSAAMLHAQSAQRPFGEAIEVSVTSVDVVVTDRSGAHVHGLSKEDFELYDNGVLQPITNFSEYRGAVITGGASAPLTAEDGGPPQAVETKRPIVVLIFIDNLHLQVKTRERALKASARFLEARAGDPLRVIAVRWNGAMRAKPLRGSGPQIAAALPQLFGDSADELIQSRERRRIMVAIDERLINDCPDTHQMVVTYAESIQHDTSATVDALIASVNSLRGFDGRKVLMFISDGVPQMAAPELFKYWSEKCGGNVSLETLQYDMSKSFERAGQAANAAGVSFYTLDATGIGSEEMFAVDGAHFGGHRLDASLMRDNRRDMLDYLADTTGGASIKNQNVFDAALTAMGNDLRDYYSLGYRTPAGRELHNIKVRIKREGLTVRARQQYVVTSPQQKIASQIESMFVVPVDDANPLDVRVSAAPAHDEGGLHILPITIRVPRQRLITIEGAGQVTLYLAAMDADGRSTPIRTMTRDVPPSGDVIESLELAMRSGDHAIVVGVRDDVSATLSLVRIDVKL